MSMFLFIMLMLIPAPGKNGCVLRWMPKDSSKPVQF